jgi:hypothetical protein
VAESLDYRNPFMAATIVTVEGDRFPLWLKTSAAAQAAARLGGTFSLPFVTELSVELQLAYLPIIKLTLTPPYRNAIDFLNSRLIEWGQSTLEVQFGYVQQQSSGSGRAVLSPVYSGILLKPEVQQGQDTTIVLNAQGVGGFAAVRLDGNLTIKASRREVVKQLTQKFGLEIDDSEILKLSTTQASVVAEWNKTPIDFAQGGDSYWSAMIKTIRSGGFFTYLLGNTLKVLPASFVFGSAPSKLFRLYDFAGGRLGPADSNNSGINRVLPILSFSSPTMAVYLPGSARGFFSQDVNSFDRKEIKKFIGDADVATPRTGKGAADIKNSKTFPAANTATGDGAEHYPGDPSDAQFVQQVKAEYAAQSTLMGVQLNMETIGDPTVLPGMVGAVRGLGQRLSGNYSIFKVTSKIGSGGFTMDLETVSNVAQVLKNAVSPKGPTAPEPAIDESIDAISGGLTVDQVAI